MKRFNKKGFTIVELVIVIAVIGILAGVLIPTFSSITSRANETAAMQEATAGRDAILVLTQGTMNDKTDFFILDAKESYATKYVFQYDGGSMNNETPEEGAPYSTAKFDDDYYVAYISVEKILTNGVDGDYANILAKLATGNDKATGTSATELTNNYYKVTVGGEGVAATEIRVYYSPDLHDTCVIFLAGAQE